jgi:hypothetical protein
MITNELVGAVLGLEENEIYHVAIYKTNIRYSGFEIVNGVIDTEEEFYQDINLYEFIHLCKVWAEEKGYGILSSTEECYLIEFTAGLLAEWRYQPYMEIQAAQWILDNCKEEQ